MLRMNDNLDYALIKIRARKVVHWWQTTTLDPAADLTHETNSLCGNVNNWLNKLEGHQAKRDAENKYKFLMCVIKAEHWIRALRYRGDA